MSGSKKIKPVSQEFNTIDPNDISSDGDAKIADQLAGQKPLMGSSFDDKVKAELEKLEATEAENLRLTNENLELQGKLAEYIDEVEKLKRKIDLMPQPKAPSPEIETLKAQVKQLTDENDKYLMRISELTFENAKMTAQMQQTAKQQLPSAPVKRQIAPAANNPYRSNGYSSWN